MRESLGTSVLRTLSLPVAFAIVLAAACTQTAPPPPISPTQRAQLKELAASPESPEGLSEALAGVEAHERRRECQEKAARVAADMRARGLVTQAAAVAGGMGGYAGQKAAKAVAVVQGKAVQAQVRQLQPCDQPAGHAAVPSEQTPGQAQ